MHVLYFHQYFTTPAGSGGTRSYEFAQALLAKGHRVTMVCLGDSRNTLGLEGEVGRGIRRGEVDGIDVIQFSLEYSNYQSLLKRASVFLRYAAGGVGVALKLDYDLLFATSTPLTAGIPGVFARLLRRKPFVFEVRDLWPELPRAMGVVTNPLVLGALSALEWITYRAATSSIGLSPGIREGIARRSRVGQPIAMIPNGADLDLFEPGRREDLNLPGIGPDAFVAVFTGAHGRANGLDAILDCAAELKRRGRSDVALAFIGDGALKPALVERARSEGLDNCHFYDPIPKSELAQVLGCVDAGLMALANVPAFYYGTSPNKFFDYLSAGLPVVNNYPGWLAGLIEEHDCGLASQPDDPAGLADALCALADAPEGLKTKGKNARRLAEAKFARRHLARRFVGWLEDTIVERQEASQVPPTALL